MEQIVIIETILIRLNSGDAIPFTDLYHDRFDIEGVSPAEYATAVRELITEKIVDYTGNYKDFQDIVLTRFGSDVIKKNKNYKKYIQSKSSETFYDKIIRKAKNNPVIAVTLIIFVLIGGYIKFRDDISNLFGSDSEDANRVAKFEGRSTYQQTTVLKVDVLNLMDSAVDNYQSQTKLIADIQNRIQKEYEFEKNLPHNELALKQWQLLTDTSGHLLGGFFIRWRNKNKLSKVFIEESKTIVGSSFDYIAQLEGYKIASPN